MPRLAAALLAGAVAISPCLAAATDLCAFQDRDGVWTFTNAQTHSRCTKRMTMRDAPPGAPSGGASSTSARGGRPRSLATARLWKDHVRAAAAYYNLPEALLEAVMAVESNFNPVAMSHKGAAGLMQLMPETARDMYVRDVWSPEENIYGGARYLRVLANQYQGDVTRMLAAYNAGPEAVKRAGGRIPEIAETKEYVRKVLALYQQLKSRDGKG
jgi:soluble lytic murein transglycosylase-like protein